MALRGGAQGRAAAGELLVGLLEAEGQVKGGRRGFCGVTVLLSQVIMPQLVHAIVGYDV